MQKISSKNSWQLPLIDHMEKIISGDMQAKQGTGASTAQPGGKGSGAKAKTPFDDGEGGALLATADAAMLNFQRASCTLDASIKIWACRVDDVWSSSYRVLENLSRSDGGQAPGEEEEGQGGGGGGEDNKENPAAGKAKKGAKSAASLLAAATSGSASASATIEKNLATITVSRS